MRRVAILGSARASMRQVPWNDTGLEMWGLAWRVETLQRCDLGFEIHRPPWRPEKVGPNYVERLAKHPFPIVLHDPHPDIPNGIVFPHKEAMRLGGNYFMSSVSYMIAYAIIEQVQQIQVYGVDMVTRGEYDYQRPNAEYWLGVARGRGIEVIVAEASALLRGNFRYGETRIGENNDGPFSQAFIQDRLDDYEKQLREVDQQLQSLNGARQECEHTLKMLREGTESVEVLKTLETRLGQYAHQIRMGEAQANTTNGAKQEATAMLDFQAAWDRGGVVPGAGTGVVNAARIDAGTDEGEDPVLAERRGSVSTDNGASQEADTGRVEPVSAGGGVDNGHAAPSGNGKSRGRRAKRKLVYPKQRGKGQGQEGAEEGAGAVV